MHLVWIKKNQPAYLNEWNGTTFLLFPEPPQAGATTFGE